MPLRGCSTGRERAVVPQSHLCQFWLPRALCPLYPGHKFPFQQSSCGRLCGLRGALQWRGEEKERSRASRRAMQEGNPSCGLPYIPCGSSSPAKTKSTFSLFFFFFPLSLRPNRRAVGGGTPPALSPSPAGWEPAQLCWLPTPFPAACAAAPGAPRARTPTAEAGGGCCEPRSPTARGAGGTR